jgi:hypothetical protein
MPAAPSDAPATGSGDDRETAPEHLARRCRALADAEMRGYSPLYERLLHRVAGDAELLDLLAPLGDPGKLPVLTLAAVHDLVLAEVGGDQPSDPLATALAAAYGYGSDEHARARARSGSGSGDSSGGLDAGAGLDPWPPFRALLVGRFADVAQLVATRTVQTNEVGRASALVPALQVVVEELGAPLAVVEVGSSAGLHLLLDRFHHRYLGDGTVTTWGPADAAVQLDCTVVGPDHPPLPTGPLPLASREGIDLRPVDVLDPVERRWLQACVWPDVPDRPERLRAALELARREPPAIRSGDVLDVLGPLLAEVPDGVVPCVVSSWALAYLSRPGRQAVHDLVAEVGAHRDVALVTAEYPQVTPWVPAPDRPPAVPAGTGATLLGLATWDGGVGSARPLAWMQAHGRWLDWLTPPG